MSTASTAKSHVPSDHVMVDFGSVNTTASRYAIDQNDFAWLENIIPVGHGNARAVPGPSGIKATIASTINYWISGNIAGVDYLFVWTTTGAAYQVNLTSYAVTTIGGNGTFSTSGVGACQWKNERIVIIDNVAGYSTWDTAALTVIAAGTKGTSVASYAGRVWIANGRTVTFTDANTYNSFAGSSGAFTISDETLHSTITALVSANNFLYIYGTHSIDAVGDVRVSGGVALFSRTNLTAAVGTGFGLTIFPHRRALWFMDTHGIYALRGASPEKQSVDIDNTISYIDYTKNVSGGLVMIYNQLMPAMMFTYNDPITGTSRSLIAICIAGDQSRPRWFFGSQGNTLTLAIGTFVGNNPKFLSTDGTNIYELFSDTSVTATVSTTLQTALWDMNDPISDKQAMKLGIGVILPTNGVTFSATIDTEIGSTSVSNMTASNTIVWVNNSMVSVTWINNLSQIVTWLAVGYSLLMSDISNVGKRLGVTLTSTTPNFTVNSVLMEYIKRARW